MKFELTKWNKGKAINVLGDLTGKSIMIDDVWISGVASINIEEDAVYDSDPIPEEGYDGGKRDEIIIIFNFQNGKVSTRFCPDMQICHFWHETDSLVCFSIKKIPDYIKDEKFDLDFRLKQYEEFVKDKVGI